MTGRRLRCKPDSACKLLSHAAGTGGSELPHQHHPWFGRQARRTTFHYFGWVGAGRSTLPDSVLNMRKEGGKHNRQGPCYRSNTISPLLLPTSPRSLVYYVKPHMPISTLLIESYRRRHYLTCRSICAVRVNSANIDTVEWKEAGAPPPRCHNLTPACTGFCRCM